MRALIRRVALRVAEESRMPPRRMDALGALVPAFSQQQSSSGARGAAGVPAGDTLAVLLVRWCLTAGRRETLRCLCRGPAEWDPVSPGRAAGCRASAPAQLASAAAQPWLACRPNQAALSGALTSVQILCTASVA